MAKPASAPAMPPITNACGTVRSWNPSASSMPLTGNGECSSTRQPSSRSVLAAASIGSGSANSATRKAGSSLAMRAFLQRFLDLELRDHRQEADEQQERGEEQADEAEVERPVPEGRVEQARRAFEPVAVKRADQQHVAL